MEEVAFSEFKLHGVTNPVMSVAAVCKITVLMKQIAATLHLHVLAA
jgi:hypothetical protein